MWQGAFGLTQVAALLGVVVGTAGLVLGILNYLRDRPHVVVRLQWDMAVTNKPLYDANKLWGMVTVANLGRRAIYLSHASLKLPKGHKWSFLTIVAAIQGQKLGEGDPPATYIVSQEGLEKYKNDWKKIRAVVFDSAGKKYTSDFDASKRPSWAN